MNITMYECGFGDCFKLEDNNKNTLYVDFGIHDHSMGKSKRECRYDQIIHSMPDNCDFLLTHYHDDHYAELFIWHGPRGESNLGMCIYRIYGEYIIALI